MKPTIRKLDNGDVVVDCGRKWFRCKPDGEVIAKCVGDDGKVHARPASSVERMFALGQATTT